MNGINADEEVVAPQGSWEIGLCLKEIRGGLKKEGKMLEQRLKLLKTERKALKKRKQRMTWLTCVKKEQARSQLVLDMQKEGKEWTAEHQQEWEETDWDVKGLTTKTAYDIAKITRRQLAMKEWFLAKITGKVEAETSEDWNSKTRQWWADYATTRGIDQAELVDVEKLLVRDANGPLLWQAGQRAEDYGRHLQHELSRVTAHLC
jgi:hypothetical protein